jgi:8-oxo-dGTP diphosphatase
MEKITIGNVCFIKDTKNKKILLLKRFREPMQDLFTGVGGKVGFDEDIHLSCIREVKEETGLDVKDLKLKGILKTLLEGKDSSWILFIYTTEDFHGNLINCDEGDLEWIAYDEIFSHNLIGFIRKILPYILDEKTFVEGTIKHTITGQVLEDHLLFYHKNMQS